MDVNNQTPNFTPIQGEIQRDNTTAACREYLLRRTPHKHNQHSRIRRRRRKHTNRVRRRQHHGGRKDERK